jgi:two-component system, cell cycle response regulator
MKILVAEDDRTSALVLQKSLEKMGYEVAMASNGAEALRKINELDLNLVISDWMMPEVDGLELCRQLRHQRKGGYVYVILLTAKGRREDRLEALKSGADDFLVKPLDREELHARLHVARRILDMQAELRERQTRLEQACAAVETQNARLTEMAVTDSLTGLKNRRHFMEVLESSFEFAKRKEQPLSLAMLDVDKFKSYNDSFGHPAGDKLLIDLARTLNQSSRAYDLVARFGGEEFVILMPAADCAASRSLGDRVRAAVEHFPWPMRHVTASIGVATLTPETCSASSLLDQADQALYCSKERGRNVVTHYDDIIFYQILAISRTSLLPSACPVGP